MNTNQNQNNFLLKISSNKCFPFSTVLHKIHIMLGVKMWYETLLESVE